MEKNDSMDVVRFPPMELLSLVTLLPLMNPVWLVKARLYVVHTF